MVWESLFWKTTNLNRDVKDWSSKFRGRVAGGTKALIYS